MSENDDIAKAELGCEKVDDGGLAELKAELEALKAKIIAGMRAAQGTEAGSVHDGPVAESDAPKGAA